MDWKGPVNRRAVHFLFHNIYLRSGIAESALCVRPRVRGQISEIAQCIFLILGIMIDLYAPSMPVIFLFLNKFKMADFLATYAGFCAEIGNFYF